MIKQARGLCAPVVVRTDTAVRRDAVAGSALPAGSGALSAFRLSDGAPTSTATVPTPVHVPLSVAGSDLLVQPTDPSYACAATGPVSAVGHAS